MAVNFEQGGLAARLLPGATDGELTIDLTVSGTVPLGSYSFQVVTQDGSRDSGAVTVTVTTALIGDALTTTPPFSVHLPPFAAGVSPGNVMAPATAPVSVHLPAVITGVGPGNAVSVTEPVSVSMP
jgi:hypothetical protein